MSTELAFIPFPGTWHVQCLEHGVNEYHRDKAAALAARELHEIASHQHAAEVAAV